MNININYYKGGLAITPYRMEENEIFYDNLRAFVVVSFDYHTKEEIIKAKQCFYRSTGSNSNKQFGSNTSDQQARGTWIPTNVVVVNITKNVSTKKMEIQELIYKPPFVIQEEGTLLSRFGGDKQLALISYALGGGIWNVDYKMKQLKLLFPKIKLPPPGYAELIDTKLVKTSYKQLNFYINKNNSYNWRPADRGFKEVSGLKVVDFSDEIFWVKVKNRCFIPISLLSPLNLKNIIKMLKKYNKNIAYQSVMNLFNIYKWSKPEMFYLCEEKTKKRPLEEESENVSKKKKL
jgi:hypothetical protein